MADLNVEAYEVFDGEYNYNDIDRTLQDIERIPSMHYMNTPQSRSDKHCSDEHDKVQSPSDHVLPRLRQHW